MMRPAGKASPAPSVIYNSSPRYSVTVNIGSGSDADPAAFEAAIRRILEEHDEAHDARARADLRRMLND